MNASNRKQLTLLSLSVLFALSGGNAIATGFTGNRAKAIHQEGEQP